MLINQRRQIPLKDFVYAVLGLVGIAIFLGVVYGALDAACVSIHGERACEMAGGSDE